MGDLPHDLNALYDRILRRISQKSEIRKVKVVKLLYWLAFGGRYSTQDLYEELIKKQQHLTTAELVEATAIDPKKLFAKRSQIGEPAHLFDDCLSLITLTKDPSDPKHWERSSIQLAHPSVLRYLKSKNLLGDPLTEYTDLFVEEFFAESCLQYLLSLNRKNNVFLAIEDKKNPFPLLKYAAEFWMVHARSAQNANKLILLEPTGKLAEQFLDLKVTNGSWITYGLLWWEHMGIKWNAWAKVSLSDNGLKTYVHEALTSNYVHYRDHEKHQNALPIVADLGHTALFRLALEAGTDLNVTNDNDGTALHAASFRGHTETVKLLLGSGADVNIQGGTWETALVAASVKRTDIVQLLFDHEADTNIQGEYSDSALTTAVFHENMETVQLLLDRGADVNAQDKALGSALNTASYKRNIEVVQLLINRGANVNIEGGEFGTALSAALYANEDEYMSPNNYKEEAIVQLLLDYGADATINSKAGKERKSALQYARIQHKEVIKFLGGVEEKLALEETDEETDEYTEYHKDVINDLEAEIEDWKELVNICEEIINLLLAHRAKDEE